MKQKFKTIPKFITLLLLIVLSSCQKDFDEDSYPYQNQYIIKDYSFKQANKIPIFNLANEKANAKFKQLRKLNKSTSREGDTDFSIDSTTIKEISVGDYTTYSMLITRDEPTVGYFENLVIEIDGTNQPKEYLIKYTPTQPIEYIAEHDSYTFTGNVEKYALQTCIICSGDDPAESGGGSTTWVTCTTIIMCNYSYVHVAGPNCGQKYPVTTCGTNPTGGLPPPPTEENGNNNPTGGGGTGGSSDPIVVTVPVFPCTTCLPLLENDPCLSLSKLADPTKGKVNTAIACLRSRLGNNSDGEDGVSFELSTNGLIYTNTDLPSTTVNSVPIPTGARIYGAAHTHNSGLEQIFTFNDLMVLYKLYSICDYELQPDVFFMLANDNGTIYVIKVNTFVTLKTFLLSYMNDSKYENITNLDRKVKIISDDFGNQIKLKGNSPNDFLKGFLELTKTAGIQVIEKRESGWEKLSLPVVKSNPIVKTPCN